MKEFSQSWVSFFFFCFIQHFCTWKINCIVKCLFFFGGKFQIIFVFLSGRRLCSMSSSMPRTSVDYDIELSFHFRKKRANSVWQKTHDWNLKGQSLMMSWNLFYCYTVLNISSSDGCLSSFSMNAIIILKSVCIQKLALRKEKNKGLYTESKLI